MLMHSSPTPTMMSCEPFKLVMCYLDAMVTSSVQVTNLSKVFLLNSYSERCVMAADLVQYFMNQNCFL